MTDMANKDKPSTIMNKKFIRVVLLLPLREETLLIFNDLITELSDIYGGITHSSYLEPIPFMGRWIDTENTKCILYEDNIIILFTDIDPLKNTNYKKYFTDLKVRLKKDINEKEIWMTFQSIELI